MINVKYSIKPDDYYGYSYPHETVVLSTENGEVVCTFEKTSFSPYMWVCDNFNNKIEMNCIVYNGIGEYVVIISVLNEPVLSRRTFQKYEKSECFKWAYKEMIEQESKILSGEK